MRRKAGALCTVLGILLLMGAAGLMLYNCWDDWRAGKTVAAVQEALAEAQAERNRLPAVLTPYLDEFSQTSDAAQTEMDTIEIDGYAYIGTLSIPSYGLALPVMAQWSESGLKIAPGRYSGSVWTDDLVICGHNYQRHFGNLKNLEPGDSLTITDVNGNVFDYQVEEVLILQPTAVEEMVAQGQWDLTLFTCTLGGQARVTVRCTKVS